MKCGTCGELAIGRDHACPPEWFVWLHGFDEVGAPDEARRARGHFAEDAAAAAVREWDADDRGLATRETVVHVLVRPVDKPEAGGEWFEVAGATRHEYHPRECDPPDGFGEPREILPPAEPPTTETGSGWPRPGRFTHDEALGPDCFGGTDDPGSD